MRIKDISTINAALEVAMKHATCTKKSIGAILSLDNAIISLGYNGPPDSFRKYCIPCPRLNSPSGTDMDLCPAVHAEMRVILNAHRDVRGAIMYITCGLPCKDCMKEIIEAGIVKIVSPYPLNTEDTEDRGDGYKSGESYNFNLSYEMMKSAGIEYVHDECLVKGATAHVHIKE
jgi:deoxycytidylate deaminase